MYSVGIGKNEEKSPQSITKYNSCGLKEKTRKAYEKLSEADKMEAILYIPELIKLKKDGTAYPYPATYLNQKYWK